ncbi:hypothetical protein [Paenibacillus apii]|uniref:hypothetical protein n=1 Tax=Paenibacillus apii TaxID=1850370 RepID=UPI001F362F27|nr:hypothetical protein [Paenibacillus apii]
MYIQYTMDQLCLPMDLEEDIPENHLVVNSGSYHKEKSKAWKSDISKIENWMYSETEDT